VNVTLGARRRGVVFPAASSRVRALYAASQPAPPGLVLDHLRRDADSDSLDCPAEFTGHRQEPALPVRIRLPLGGLGDPNRQALDQALPCRPLADSLPRFGRDGRDGPRFRSTRELVHFAHEAGVQGDQRTGDLLRFDARGAGDIPNRYLVAIRVEQPDGRFQNRPFPVCPRVLHSPRA
jgi:hypothetical protein